MTWNLLSILEWELTALRDQAHYVQDTGPSATGLMKKLKLHKGTFREMCVAVYIWKKYLNCTCKIGELYSTSFIP